MRTSIILTSLLLSATTTLALPSLIDYRILYPRGNTPIDPNSITGLTCTDPSVALVDHDINVALLSICGSIAGTIEQCGGEPTTTTGESGTAKFTLTAEKGTIDITKGRWEHCVAAARAVCGDSPLSATCIGGAEVNAANVDFVLAAS